MGCFGEVEITEVCDLCTDSITKRISLGQFTDPPRPLLAPFAGWIWTLDGYTYCPPCWKKMLAGAKERAG
jgi:hypothetical protein